MLPTLLPKFLVCDVIHARPHHHAERGVPGPDQRPEVLAGQVRGERLALVVAPVVNPAAACALFSLDGRADRDEFGDVGAELLQLHVQPDADDAVGLQRVGLGLHPGHGQLTRVVHGLGEHVKLLVGAPPAYLQSDVVDGAAQDQAERPEPGLADQQELIDRQVGRENGAGTARLQFREAPHGVLRNARSIQFRRYVPLIGHVLSYGMRCAYSAVLISLCSLAWPFRLLH
jgi:hypothetical protein